MKAEFKGDFALGLNLKLVVEAGSWDKVCSHSVQIVQSSNFLFAFFQSETT